MDAMVWMAGGWLVGAMGVAALDADAGALPALVTLALAAAVTLLARGSGRAPRAWWVLACGALAAASGASAHRPSTTPLSEHAGPARARLEIVERRVDRASVTLVARVVHADAASLAVDTRVRLREVDAVAGDVVEGALDFRAAPIFRNPSPHPPWPDEAPIELDARPLPPGLAFVARATWLRRALEALRDRVRAGLLATLDDPAAGIARALVLGEGRAVDLESARAVRGAGLAHVLAVSGLHVTLVAGALVEMLRRLLLRGRVGATWDARRIASAAGVPIALGYALLAGGAPSAWRAALTASIAFALVAVGRRPRATSVAACAVLAFALLDATASLRPAFLLSTVATAAILVPRAPTSALRESVAMTVRATVATAPITLYVFESLPLLGVLANVALVPLASVALLPLALVHGAIVTVSPSLGAPTAALVDGCARALIAAATLLSPSIAQLEIAPLDAIQGVALSAACAIGLLVRERRALLAVVIAAALAMGCAEMRLREVERPIEELRVTFVDVGQGDAAIVDLPDGRVMLVDGGGAVTARVDPGARVLVPLLRARRRSALDFVVLTHPHPDHYGGLAAVLEALETRELWDSGQAESERPDGEAAQLLGAARARGTRVLGPSELCGAPRIVGGASIEVIFPCPEFDAGWGPNDNSLVLRIRYGRRTILLTGDIEAHAERELASRVGRADVLKVGHHGSRTSSTDAFLDAVQPSLAVVSAGRGNRFGHPHAEVEARYAARGISLVRLDRQGGTIVTTDGEWLSIAPYLRLRDP